MFSLKHFFKTACIIIFLIGSSSSANEKCDCPALKQKGESCSPDCFILCSLQGAFQEAQSHICEKKHNKKIKIASKKVDIKSLPKIFEKAGQKIMAIKNSLSANDPDCKSCSPVSKIQNITRPAKFEEETCPESSRKIHYFQKSIKHKLSEDKTGCIYEEMDIPSYQEKPEGAVKLGETRYAMVAKGKAKRKVILDALNEYSQKTLKGDNPEGEKLNKSCPDECSFYVSSVMAFQEEKCAGTMDMYINCNHKRSGSLIFGMDYLVDIHYKENLQCEKSSA